MNALCGQQLRRLQRLADHQATGEHRSILTLPEDVGLADLEGIVLLENRGGQPGGPQIGGTLHLSQSEGGLSGLVAVGRDDDSHAGDHSHKADILDGLVAAAVLAHGHAGVGAADLHIETGVGDGVADLLIGPACAEHSKGGAEGNEPHGGQARRHIHHVALGNAAVKEAIGIGRLEKFGHGSPGQIGIQHHNLIVGSAQLYQRLAVGFTGGDFFTHALSPPIPSKPAGAAPRWEPCRASPPDPP